MNPIRSIFDSIVYINKNISNKITLEQCSMIAHMSVSYYIEKFKQTIGLTPHKYIMKRRLELSTNSLLEQNRLLYIMSIKQFYFRGFGLSVRTIHDNRILLAFIRNHVIMGEVDLLK